MHLSFGEKLRNLREDRDLSQEKLGEKINMTQRKISYLERNQFEPSISDIVAICNFFNISADALLETNYKFSK